MTRRKRTPSPDQLRKRVEFNIPASLQQLSALSRSLAIQNGAGQEKDNSDIVARAQAISQSPTADVGWLQDGKQQQAKELRFKHDSRQFPSQQEWLQPTANQGAVGHARFLEKQWQAAQAAENMRRAQFMQQQMEENRQRPQDQAMHKPSTPSFNTAPESSGAALSSASTNTSRQKTIEFVSKHQREFSDSQQWPNAAPRDSQRQYDVDIEQRRQAIIAKLMERQPASVATSSSNIQIPTSSSPQPTVQQLEPPAELDSPLDLTTQPNQIAALIERKKAENAANGSLNRWLAAQTGHQRLRDEAKKDNRNSPAAHGQAAGESSPKNPLVFKPDHRNLAGQMPRAVDADNMRKENRAPAQQVEPGQDLDLRSLFSSPAPSPRRTPSQLDPLSRNSESQDNSSKDGPTQLPSPSLSSPSQHEVHRAPSPSAQLLMNLANAAPPSATNSSQQSTFRTPSLTVSTEGLTRTSSAARQRASTSKGSISVEGPLTPQQQEMRLMHRQSEQQRQERNRRQFQQMQAQAAQAQYTQVQPQQTLQRSQPSASVTSNTSNYYKIKPHLWDAFGADKFAMSPPSYVQSGPSNVLGSNASPSSGDYNMSTMNALDNSNMYSGPRGAGYGSFANGGGANANFRMSTQTNFGVPKR